ncbi:hypothetical protein GQ42DRAFT_164508 [Ramicandelaber brevisporus]|nr:hypothetical protein GQ42DRAFT_164508 [Ramicandelaber brevisporus]
MYRATPARTAASVVAASARRAVPGSRAVSLLSLRSRQQQQRLFSTSPASRRDESKNAFIQIFANLFPKTFNHYLNIGSGVFIFRGCSAELKHGGRHRAFFVDHCGLPDTFHSWFIISHLHMWMMMVRLRIEPEGKALNQEIVNALFGVLEDKMRDAGVTSTSIIDRTSRDLLQVHGGCILAYDEALTRGSDSILATALWRNLYGCAGLEGAPKDANTPEKCNVQMLADLVKYVRVQMANLEKTPIETIRNGAFSFESPNVVVHTKSEARPQAPAQSESINSTTV